MIVCPVCKTNRYPREFIIESSINGERLEIKCPCGNYSSYILDSRIKELERRIETLEQIKKVSE